MRCLAGLVCVLALGVMPLVGCGDSEGAGGSAGDGGSAGVGGGGVGGDGGVGGHAGAGGSQSLCVDNVCECSEAGIRAAIAEGGQSWYYWFDCQGPTTIFTADEIVIDSRITLDGDNDLTIDGNDSHRVFSIGGLVELRGMTIQNGRSGDVGAGIKNTGWLTLRDTVVSGNVAASDGGGVYNLGNLTIQNSTIANNVAGVQDCGEGRPCRFGGGIWNAGELAVERTTLSGNLADGGGGIYNQAFMTLTNVSVTANTTTSGNCGAGVDNHGNARVTESSFTLNSAACQAGFSNERDLVLTNVTIANNFNGGFYNTGEGTAMLIGSTVSNNTGDGSGIISHGLAVTLVNSTVSENSSSGDWVGGIHVVNGLTLINSTVSNNVGGDILVGDSTATIAGSIIGGTCEGSFDSLGNNVESPGDSCGLNHASDQVNVSVDELQLGPLADNGGSTMTHALGDGSVAIDVIPVESCLDADGEPLTTDQRGYRRPHMGMCDAGSFEHGASIGPEPR